MTAPAAIVVNPSLYLIGGLVLISVIIGTVDLLRQPTWAWRAGGESKPVSLLLVLLLPGVGLAIYVFATRPKLVEIAAAGRAANLPFERFGDQPTLATRRGRHIQTLARPTVFGSFGERREVRTIRASGPDLGTSATGNFFDDPDLVTVPAPVAAVDPAPVGAPVAVDTAEPEIRIPGSLGRPYHPKQRTSLEDGQSLASVAAQIFVAADDTGPQRSVWPVPAPPRSFGGPTAQPGSVPVLDTTPTAQAAGPSLATRAAPASYCQEPGPIGAAPQSITPRLVPGSSDSGSPAVLDGGSMAGGSPMATATMTAAPPTVSAQWLPDPTGRHNYRYWDGDSWTGNVSDAGIQSQDPISA
jgi:hypothetical protein